MYDYSESSYLWMLKELERAKQAGIPIVLNGEEVEKNQEPKWLLVREDSNYEASTYMEDFVSDAQGRIVQIHFDRVRYLSG